MDEKAFFSTERLIEFGMSMAIAQQMTRQMNEMMTNTTIINSPASMAQKQIPERVYYAAFEGKQAGPFSETELTRLIMDKKLTKETLVWHPGLEGWKPAENIPEILRLVALTPPQL
ncbi:MAG: DUF4339 domain-containing protein [Spirochaetales bacterium]|jgi:hypothetical protein|nr:DUF4339 domain-containing protein [Spirochaetales bacterium]